LIPTYLHFALPERKEVIEVGERRDLKKPSPGHSIRRRAESGELRMLVGGRLFFVRLMD